MAQMQCLKLNDLVSYELWSISQVREVAKFTNATKFANC